MIYIKQKSSDGNISLLENDFVVVSRQIGSTVYALIDTENMHKDWTEITKEEFEEVTHWDGSRFTDLVIEEQSQETEQDLQIIQMQAIAELYEQNMALMEAMAEIYETVATK